MIRFIGDIHYSWRGYLNAIVNCDYTIQVGDFGLGFPGYDFPEHILNVPGKHRFIRGNHDNPEVCREHPWYLGDYGYLPENDIFFMGGAWSPDFYKRIEGIDWWRNEELDYGALDCAIDMCTRLKPRIIVTHDCPRIIKKNYLGRNGYAGDFGDRYTATRTDNALQVIFERHQPDIWIFGHYHQRMDERIDGTRFVCIEEFGVFDVE